VRRRSRGTRPAATPQHRYQRRDDEPERVERHVKPAAELRLSTDRPGDDPVELVEGDAGPVTQRWHPRERRLGRHDDEPGDDGVQRAPNERDHVRQPEQPPPESAGQPPRIETIADVPELSGPADAGDDSGKESPLARRVHGEQSQQEGHECDRGDEREPDSDPDANGSSPASLGHLLGTPRLGDRGDALASRSAVPRRHGYRRSRATRTAINTTCAILSMAPSVPTSAGNDFVPPAKLMTYHKTIWTRVKRIPTAYTARRR